MKLSETPILDIVDEFDEGSMTMLIQMLRALVYKLNLSVHVVDDDFALLH